MQSQSRLIIAAKSIKTVLQKLAFVVSLILSMGLLAACQQPPDAHDAQGRAIRLADYHGKWVVINYWATWCQPCLSELPELNQFSKQYADKAVVLGVSFDRLPNNEIQQLAQRLKLQFPLLSDFPLNKLGVDSISALPITFLVAPDGHLKGTLHGPQTAQSLAKAIALS